MENRGCNSSGCDPDNTCVLVNLESQRHIMSKKKFVNISLGSLAILLTSQFYGCVFPEEGKATNTDDNMFDEEEGEGRGLDTYGSIQVTAHVMKWL